jgi:hypothetical protein
MSKPVNKINIRLSIIIRIVAFLKATQMQNIWANRRIIAIFLQLWMMFGAIACAYIVLQLLKNPASMRVTPNKIMEYVLMMTIIVSIARHYFPSYNSTQNTVPNIFPLNKWERGSINLLSEILSAFYANFYLFHTTLFCLSSYVTTEMYVSAVVTLLTIAIAERSMRLTFDFNRVNRIAHSAISLLCLGILSATLPLQQNIFAQGWLRIVYLFGVFVCILTYHYFLISGGLDAVFADKSRRRDEKKASHSIWNLALLAFHRTTHIRILQGIVLGLMLLICWGFYPLPTLADPRLYRIIAFLTAFLSCLPSFAYIYSNSFGLQWHLWQTFQLHTGNTMRLYFYLVLPIMLVFSFMQLGFFIIFGIGSAKTLLCCASINLMLLPLGYFISSRFPLKREVLPKFFAQEASASRIGEIIILSIALGLAYSQALPDNWFYAVQCLNFALALTLLAVGHKKQQSWKYYSFTAIH